MARSLDVRRCTASMVFGGVRRVWSSEVYDESGVRRCKEGTNFDDGKRFGDVKQHQDRLMCIDVGKKNTSSEEFLLLTI